MERERVILDCPKFGCNSW